MRHIAVIGSGRRAITPRGMPEQFGTAYGSTLSIGAGALRPDPQRRRARPPVDQGGFAAL